MFDREAFLGHYKVHRYDIALPVLPHHKSLARKPQIHQTARKTLINADKKLRSISTPFITFRLDLTLLQNTEKDKMGF